MKRILLVFVVIAASLFYFSCSSNPKSEESAQVSSEEGLEVNEAGGFGKVITTEGAMDVDNILVKMEEGSEFVGKVKGEVIDCCQNSGCWMNIAYGDDKAMRVTFKDYGFFVPKDIAGKQVIFEGIASFDTTSVEMLRHFAEDAGKSSEEIEGITEPQLDLVFEAEGVLLL